MQFQGWDFFVDKKRIFILLETPELTSYVLNNFLDYKKQNGIFM